MDPEDSRSDPPPPRVGLVDYGRGNLRSVGRALEVAGARVEWLTAPARFDAMDALVVPGVGAFGDCARNLKNAGLWEALREWLRDGRPYLGICLGYQLLFESSEESPGAEGLSHFPGRVVRFSPTEPNQKIPHMGWNTLSHLRGPLFSSAEKSPPAVYFVHSYYPRPTDPDLASSTCTYGDTFAASISRGAVHATQFHPEKSQQAGLTILRNFLSTLTPTRIYHGNRRGGL